MKNIDIKIKLKNGLELEDPFMIASSHLTDSVNAFQNLAPIKPAAITTKTISAKYGGDLYTPKPGRELSTINTWSENKIGLYADGPKETELWGVSIAHDSLIEAKKILPDTKIGISILQGEDYNDIKSILKNNYDYVELNLKYSLRLDSDKLKKIYKVLPEIKNDITDFCDVFKEFPKFIKVSREAYSFFTEIFITDTFEIIKKNNVAVIIANSKKMDGPPSYVKFRNTNSLKNGVIVGDYLFPETYNIIKEFNKLNKEIEIVANGGIMSIGEIFDCLPFGIKSFQICTLVHRKGIYVIEMLRKQLKCCIKKYNCNNFEKLSNLIMTDQSELKKLEHFFISKNDLAQIIETKGIDDNKKSLNQELSIKFRDSKIPVSEYNENINFVGTKGSILSYYLSFYLSRFKNYIVSVENSKDIIKSKFEAAIMLNAYSNNFKQKVDDYELDEIGKVRYGLMSITQDFTKIKKVFLFSSAGSEEARIELLKQNQFKFEYEYLTPEKLAPLLIGWDESLAILAKYPLSNFYKHLLPEDVQNKWHNIFLVEKSIWLCTKKKPGLKNKIINDIQSIMKDISDNSINNFIYFSFLDYIVELMTEKKN